MKNKQLAIYGGPKTINSSLPKYTWPVIDNSVEKAVLKQLKTTISIYNNSGIIKEFEDNWKNYHNSNYALTTNSGTSAIFSLFIGIGIQKGDEVICPNYTFFATISSIVSLGANPIFCDSDKTGNINAKLIASLITGKTRALIITHMWGIPCDMDLIVAICDFYNIALIEDCSHAHGAEYKGKKVGTFGIGAAWSLQGQKIVSGGEGGILLSKSRDVFEKALLLGHYNKRCKDQISKKSPYQKFYLTGFGHKFRAHPIAIAIANQQFKKLDYFLKIKRGFADELIKELSSIDFLIIPSIKNIKPSWYAFTFLFDCKKSNGYSREDFVKALHAEGLKDIDIPNSTCPLSKLPLFKKTYEIYPHLYSIPIKESINHFPISESFFKSVIKMPVWALENEENNITMYIKGIKKVSSYIIKNPK